MRIGLGVMMRFLCVVIIGSGHIFMGMVLTTSGVLTYFVRAVHKINRHSFVVGNTLLGQYQLGAEAIVR